MKNRLLHIGLLALMLLAAVVAPAEVVYLRSGGQMEGTIVFQNEEVVVLKDAKGARYQYMMADVDHIAAEAEAVKEEEQLNVKHYGKKVAVGLSVAGGASVLHKDYAGGAFLADVSVGTANLFDKKIFVGGAVGFHTNAMPGKGDEKDTYSFLPIQARAEIPFLQGKHAPMVGLGVGYGISVTKQMKGGLFADFQLGWRYQINNKNSLFLGAFCSFQNAKINGLQEQIEDVAYVDDANRNFFNAGAKLTFYL